MSRVVWNLQSRSGGASHLLGMLPYIISSCEDRAADQLNKRYKHGGGYAPWGKGEFSLVDTNRNAFDVLGKFKALAWQNAAGETDEPYLEIAHAETRHEHVYLFEAAVLAIVDKETGDLNVTRVD